jgi:hypothetical protein
MGDWHGTCGLSQLPIRRQTKTYLQFLVKMDTREEYRSNIGGGYCHPNALWVPLMFPICGVYDDYGGLEKIKTDDNVKHIMSYVKKLHKEGTLQVEEDYSDKVFTNIKTFVKAVERGAITKTSIHSGKPVEISFMLMLGSVYESAIKLISESKHVWLDETADVHISKLMENRGKFDFESHARFENFMAEKQKRKPRPVSRLVCFATSSDSGYSYVYHPYEIDIGASADLEKAAKNYLLLDIFLHKTRKSYSPQSGAGMQECDLNFHTQFCQAQLDAVNGIKDKMRKEYMKWNGEVLNEEMLYY